VLSYLRGSGKEELLVVINLSNTPFHGTVDTYSDEWQDVKGPLSHDSQVAIPSASVDALGFSIFEKR